ILPACATASRTWHPFPPRQKIVIVIAIAAAIECAMQVGVPKEIKNHEYRVGLVPSSVAELVHRGHAVLVESGAGAGAGLGDDDYRAAGGTLVEGPDR